MFNEYKVAQMAAFFLNQTEKKRMPHLKLMKLLYLADREAVRQFGFSISEDMMVAMPHGPVLSRTLDLMNGYTNPNRWEEWISDKENHEVSLNKLFKENTELDELSQAELTILNLVWAQFGTMNQWEIRDWTHDNCQEWQDPQGSSYPISFEKLACAVGFQPEIAKELARSVETEAQLDQFFAHL